MTTTVPLNGDLVALIDDEDAERVLARAWVVYTNGHGNVYVRSRGWGRSGDRLYLHRFVLDVPAGRMVDHIDGNGLDNRRANLRLTTHSLNGANARKGRGTSSRFKGVYWNTRLGKWHAQIGRGSRQYLGLFTDETDAARAYDDAARTTWGEYARLNFPDAT